MSPPHDKPQWAAWESEVATAADVHYEKERTSNKAESREVGEEGWRKMI